VEAGGVPVVGGIVNPGLTDVDGLAASLLVCNVLLWSALDGLTASLPVCNVLLWSALDGLIPSVVTEETAVLGAGKGDVTDWTRVGDLDVRPPVSAAVPNSEFIELTLRKVREDDGGVAEAGRGGNPDSMRVDDPKPLPPVPVARLSLRPVPDIGTPSAEVEGGAVPGAKRGDDFEPVKTKDPRAWLPVLEPRLLLGLMTDDLVFPAGVEGGGIPEARKDVNPWSSTKVDDDGASPPFPGAGLLL